ncbi:TetR/AcrR family transcriptional regulator [Henriciella sp. AS95]|uniref:TetR/AcrR family transcriptional regulator n=1 Tax=Henriciella sp. AS95 TaxID=3135782 RepID=UPI00317CF50B
MSETSSIVSGEDKRLDMIRATIKCLTRKGIGNTNMTDIAREAGVARVTLYREFGTREKLLEAVVVYRLKQFNLKFFASVVGVMSFPELIEAYLLESVRFARSNPVTPRLTDGRMTFMREGSLIREASRECWAPIILKAQREGDLSPGIEPRDAADWLLSLQYTLSRLSSEGGMDEDSLSRLVKAFAVPAFRTGNQTEPD